MRTAILATVCVFFASPAFADDVKPKWSLKVGDEFYATITHETITKMDVGSQAIQQKMKLSVVARYIIQSVKNDAIVVKMMYHQLAFQADPKVPNAPEIPDKLNVGSFSATLNDKFEITQFEGYDKFIDKLSGDDKSKRKIVESLFPETGVRAHFHQAFIPLAGDKTPKGEKWSSANTTELWGLGKLTTETQYRLEGTENNIATIRSTAETEMKPGDETDKLPFKITKTKLKSDTFNGTILFDTKTGRLKSSTTVLLLNGTMTMLDTKQKPFEMKLDVFLMTKVVLSDKNPVRD
jgi:hypothetical protein